MKILGGEYIVRYLVAFNVDETAQLRRYGYIPRGGEPTVQLPMTAEELILTAVELGIAPAAVALLLEHATAEIVANARRAGGKPD